MPLTAVELTALAAAILSLAFSYIPRLNTWYAVLEENQKKLIQIGLLVLAALLVFIAGCVPPIVAQYGDRLGFVACSAAGAWQLLFLVVEAVAVNQGIYLISPVSPAVRVAKQLNARLRSLKQAS